MPPFVDSLILHFDDDLQTEARTVVSRSPEPQNAFEVAVILETIGHTDDTSRARGYGDLFALADAVYESLEDFSVARDPSTTAVAEDGRRSSRVEALALFVGSSLPWLAALIIQITTGTGFWSAAALPPRMAAAMVLALTVGLVSSAIFIVPYSRRATFYRLQGNRSLAAWTALRILGTGVVVSVAAAAGGYLLLEKVFAAYTPETTRAFLAMTVAIALLQLSLAPLYAMRAFRWLTVAVLAGAIVLIAGFVSVNHGIFTNPASVIRVQLLAIGSMVTVATIGDVWTLRPLPGDEPVAMAPRPWAIARSVLPYAIFGGTYFLVVLQSQLVAGGLWHGGFHYVSGFATANGWALLILLPLFASLTAAGERFSEVSRSLLASRPIAESDAVFDELGSLHRRHIRRLLEVGLGVGLVMIAAAVLSSPHWAVAAAMTSHLGLYIGSLGAYLALSFGLLSSHVLFSFSRPDRAAWGGAIGVVVGLGASGLADLAFADTTSAVVGLIAGTVTFALVTARAANTCTGDLGSAFFGAV